MPQSLHAPEDAPIGTSHFDAATLAAWEAHCAQIARWVADDRLTPETGALLCDLRAMVGWMRAYRAELQQP